MGKLREYLKSKKDAIKFALPATLILVAIFGYWAFLGLCVYSTRADWYGLPTWAPFIVLFAILAWVDYRSFEPSGGSNRTFVEGE